MHLPPIAGSFKNIYIFGGDAALKDLEKLYCFDSTYCIYNIVVL